MWWWISWYFSVRDIGDLKENDNNNYNYNYNDDYNNNNNYYYYYSTNVIYIGIVN